MKKISLSLILAATVASACGGNATDCGPNKKTYFAGDTYSCVENCNDICNFDGVTLTIFETEDGQCTNTSFNESAFICGSKKNCSQFNINNILISKTAGGAFSCAGYIDSDGVHLQCEAGQYNGDQTCQEAIFKKNE